MPLGPEQRRDRSNSPEVEFARYLKNIESRITDLETRRFVIPLLDADPPVELGINIWIFPDGRMRMYRPTTNVEPVTYQIIEYAAVSTPGPAFNTVASVPTNPVAPTTRQVSYTATWSQSYTEDGSQRLDVPTKVTFGWQNSTGRNRSLIGFDWVSIAADLANSTIKKVSLQLQMFETLESTATTWFGVHDFSSAPSTWQGELLPLSQVISGTFVQNTLQEIDLTIDFATYIRAGLGKGIALEVPSDSSLYSGSASGVGSMYPAPTLIVEYVK